MRLFLYDSTTTDYEPSNVSLIRSMSRAVERLSDRYSITSRESEILVLIAVYGLSNGEIAECCVISEKTVTNHVANIMRKLGIHSMRKMFSMVLREIADNKENLG